MKMIVDAEIFETADKIASAHIRKGWLEPVTSAVIRKIKLRQDIYNAICVQRSAGRTLAKGGISEWK